MPLSEKQSDGVAQLQQRMLDLDQRMLAADDWLRYTIGIVVDSIAYVDIDEHNAKDKAMGKGKGKKMKARAATPSGRIALAPSPKMFLSDRLASLSRFTSGLSFVL